MNIIDINTEIAISGSTGDSVSERYSVRTDSAVFQYSIGGATTATDVHLEARLADDADWEDWIAAKTGLTSGDSGIQSIDLDSISEIRVRAVNQDGSNTGSVRLIVSTSDD
jgi:hypothetical protein